MNLPAINQLSSFHGNGINKEVIKIPLSSTRELIITKEKDPGREAAKDSAVKKLQSIDAMVRAHENAHLSVLGAYAASSPQYSYIMGPDGKLYAVGGSVAVDMSTVPGDPQATYRKARAIAQAAFGPMQSSGADIETAAAANQIGATAEARMHNEQVAKLTGQGKEDNLSEIGQSVDVYA